MERLHAWSGREPAGYRGHNPNTPTPLGLLTRHADGCISIVSQESLLSLPSSPLLDLNKTCLQIPLLFFHFYFTTSIEYDFWNNSDQIKAKKERAPSELLFL